MARGQNLLCVAVLLAVAASCVTADLLPTYREEGDQELHESGRQVISLTTSGTVANYTINLTGIIMLGLGVATATMFWIHLATLGIGKRSATKRSFDERSTEEDSSSARVATVLANMHQRFAEAGVEVNACRQRVICEASRPKLALHVDTFGHALNAFFATVAGDDELTDQIQSDHLAALYHKAWLHGRQTGNKNLKPCKAVYDHCPMTTDEAMKLIKSQ